MAYSNIAYLLYRIFLQIWIKQTQYIITNYIAPGRTCLPAAKRLSYVERSCSNVAHKREACASAQLSSLQHRRHHCRWLGIYFAKCISKDICNCPSEDQMMGLLIRLHNSRDQMRFTIIWASRPSLPIDVQLDPPSSWTWPCWPFIARLGAGILRH